LADRLQPAAEFLELGLPPSDSEKFLTPPISNGFFPKGSKWRSEKGHRRNLFTKSTIFILDNNEILYETDFDGLFFHLKGEKNQNLKRSV